MHHTQPVFQIPKEHESFVKSQINKLNYISVRENSGLKILYNLGIKKGVHVVDPVFLLSSNQWMQLATLPIYNNYILVYDQENNATIKKIALYLSKKSGLLLKTYTLELMLITKKDTQVLQNLSGS